MIIKIKNIIAYMLLFIGTIYALKTGTLALNKFLFYFNINNSLGMDLTNCHTFALSIIKSDFYYALFLFALLCLIIGFFLLFREQKLNLNREYFNIGFFILFLILLGQSFMLIGYIVFFILEDSLFNQHIIYTFAFIIGCFTNLFFLILYSLIWFDKNLDNKGKLICLLILCCFSTHVCIKMFSFINLYGVDNVETGVNPNSFFEAFDYILTNLGFAVFCMEENLGDNNPCKDLLENMHKQCDFYHDAKSIPRVPYAGGSSALTWIARIMNVGVTLYKYDKRQDCNEARRKYHSCEDFFKSENYKKNKPK